MPTVINEPARVVMPLFVILKINREIVELRFVVADEYPVSRYHVVQVEVAMRMRDFGLPHVIPVVVVGSHIFKDNVVRDESSAAA